MATTDAKILQLKRKSQIIVKMSKSNNRKILALVPVRAGSKGLKDKNIRPFSGRPLYEHAVLQGLRIADSCVISTDIQPIITYGGPPGSKVISRPAELATDTATMDAVIHDAITQLQVKNGRMVLLQATTPLRRIEDIQKAINLFETKKYDLVMSVTSTDPTPLKYGLLDDDQFKPVSSPEYCFSNRQALPQLYKPNGAVYIFNIEWFIENGTLATKHTGAFRMPERMSVDIDKLEDFQRAERLYTQNIETDTK